MGGLCCCLGRNEGAPYEIERSSSSFYGSTPQSGHSYVGDIYIQNAVSSRPRRLDDIPQSTRQVIDLPQPNEQSRYIPPRLRPEPTKQLIETTESRQLIRNVFNINYFPDSSIVQFNTSFGDNRAYTIDTLLPTDYEFRDVKRRITNRHFIVDSIGVINAPFLEKIYLLKKEQKRPIEELELFHGTKRENADLICTNNFNWRYHGKNVGQRFGRGVSFSCNAMYAAHYSKNESQKVMFIAKVMVSKRCKGGQGMVLPDDGCDASTKQEDDIVLVKYEDNEFYPIYLIRFHILPGYVPFNKRSF